MEEFCIGWGALRDGDGGVGEGQHGGIGGAERRWIGCNGGVWVVGCRAWRGGAGRGGCE